MLTSKVVPRQPEHQHQTSLPSSPAASHNTCSDWSFSSSLKVLPHKLPPTSAAHPPAPLANAVLFPNDEDDDDAKMSAIDDDDGGDESGGGLEDYLWRHQQISNTGGGDDMTDEDEDDEQIESRREARLTPPSPKKRRGAGGTRMSPQVDTGNIIRYATRKATAAS